MQKSTTLGVGKDEGVLVLLEREVHLQAWMEFWRQRMCDYRVIRDIPPHIYGACH